MVRRTAIVLPLFAVAASGLAVLTNPGGLLARTILVEETSRKLFQGTAILVLCTAVGLALTWRLPGTTLRGKLLAVFGFVGLGIAIAAPHLVRGLFPDMPFMIRAVERWHVVVVAAIGLYGGWLVWWGRRHYTDP